VGGDWYDFIPFEDGRWGLVLADVSGKGTAAALLMSATRGMLRSLATACCPSEVLAKLNPLLVNDFPSGRFVTMLYAILDPSERTLRFASAGHLRPLLIDDSQARFLETERGLPLGIGLGEYSEAEIHLSQGARLLFYSDGITEATNPEGEEYGAERLEKHFRRSDASAESILEDVRKFADGEGLHDDATVILVKA
jgi:sigma-B regulation protein RsbU (phosphoserine phosphatase)